uniref:Uncharacterized protein n=1 Tax=Brassica oleracea TaxID=3712 RepID=A0A3P6ERR1_BRAOL|nr:unnamed protein product [Brassica oleracea]
MRSRICNGSPRVNGLKSSSIAIPLRSSLLRRSAAKTYVLKSVTEDIKEKIPYVAQIKLCNQGNVTGSFSPCRRHFMLQKLKNMKNYNNYLEECRSEDEAVQFYFQRLTMTTMLRRVVKRSVADFVFLVTTHHTHGILETFSYMFSLCCLGWKPMTKKLKFVA